MRYAVKIPRKIRAYRLGDKSKAELELIREGAIKPLSGERYELFSQEAVNGKGEIALKGDYFKVDTVEGRHFPYPNKKAYFEKHHRQLYEDYYETVNSPVGVWQFGDDMCNEVKFLLENGKMTIDEQNEYGYFNAELWGAPLTAAKDSSVIFYHIDYDSEGNITDVDFNFVNSREFKNNYIFCGE